MGWYEAQTQAKVGDPSPDRALLVSGTDEDGNQVVLKFNADGELKIARQEDNLSFEHTTQRDILLQLKLMNHHLSIMTGSELTTDEL